MLTMLVGGAAVVAAVPFWGGLPALVGEDFRPGAAAVVFVGGGVEAGAGSWGLSDVGGAVEGGGR